jgi:hypothetical protein
MPKGSRSGSSSPGNGAGNAAHHSLDLSARQFQVLSRTREIFAGHRSRKKRGSGFHRSLAYDRQGLGSSVHRGRIALKADRVSVPRPSSSMMARRSAALVALGRVASGRLGFERVGVRREWASMSTRWRWWAKRSTKTTAPPHRETPARAAPGDPSSARFSYEELTQAGSRRSPIRCHNSAGNRESPDFCGFLEVGPRHPADSRARSSAWSSRRIFGFRHTYIFGKRGGHLGPPRDAAFILPSAVSGFWLPIGCPFSCSPGCPSDAAFVAQAWAALVASRVLPLLVPACGLGGDRRTNTAPRVEVPSLGSRRMNARHVALYLWWTIEHVWGQRVAISRVGGRAHLEPPSRSACWRQALRGIRQDEGQGQLRPEPHLAPADA